MLAVAILARTGRRRWLTNTTRVGADGVVKYMSILTKPRDMYIAYLQLGTTGSQTLLSFEVGYQ